jgi:spermidine/putrescine-binding protein
MNDFPARPLSPAGTMRRRELLARAAQMGIALPALGALGAACGSGSSSPPSSSSGPPKGTAVLLNYQGWMGKHTVAEFETAYPGAGIKQASLGSISSGAIVPQIKANMSTYDAALGDEAAVGQGLAADIIQQLDWSKIPNIKNVDQKFRSAYTHGIPTDYGKTGIGYRTDLVSEPITSWADLWNLAPKYSGKIVFVDLDRDCIGSALKYKGYSVNTTDQNQLNQALQALIDIKPHLQALKSYNIGQAPTRSRWIGTTTLPLPSRTTPTSNGCCRRRAPPRIWRDSSPSRIRPRSRCWRRSSTTSSSPNSTPTS